LFNDFFNAVDFILKFYPLVDEAIFSTIKIS